jgi:hypothetical protein
MCSPFSTKQPGATLEAGDILGILALDDPSRVKHAQPFTGHAGGVIQSEDTEDITSLQSGTGLLNELHDTILLCDEGQSYAEVEVMKMYMPLIAKEDGIVQLIKQPGATLEAFSTVNLTSLPGEGERSCVGSFSCSKRQVLPSTLNWKEEAAATRLSVDGKTCLLEQENDPTQLRSPSHGWQQPPPSSRRCDCGR